jgi:hypothetical protein
MPTIRVEVTKEDKEPKKCEDRAGPVRNGRYYEFKDANEEELAFWNALDSEERRKLTDESYEHCFYGSLHSFMEQEAAKGERMKETESGNIGARSESPNPPSYPPVTPPTGGPPVQDRQKSVD